MHIEVGLALEHMPSTNMSDPMTAAAQESFHVKWSQDNTQRPGSSKRNSPHRLLLDWMSYSSCGKSKKLARQPPVRKPILVCATITVRAVIPAQVVTPLETTAPWASDTRLLALVGDHVILIMQD